MAFDFVTAAALLSQFANLAEKCLSLAGRAGEQQAMKEKLAEQQRLLRDALVAAREEVSALREKCLELEARNRELAKLQDSAPKEVKGWREFVAYLPKHSTYWIGPCCPNCYTNGARFVVLKGNRGFKEAFECPTCKGRFENTIIFDSPLNPEE